MKKPLKIISLPVSEGLDWMDDADTCFASHVELNRRLGYGRMMQIISCVWASRDPAGALTVGGTYATIKRRKERCERDGHDWDPNEGREHKWCDRCGINGEKS